MSRRQGIPRVPDSNPERQRFDGALKERIELFSGERGGKIKLLEATATEADRNSKINEIITLLQGA